MVDQLANSRRIVNDIVIQHHSFHQMLECMEALWRDAEARIPIIAPFIGETGTGKTTAIRAFAMKHPPRRTPDGLVIPVLVIEIPAKPTPRSLGERILRALGDPRPTAGSAANKLDRIVTNMAGSQVRVGILDDGHHFVDKRQRIALFEASDYLKEILVSIDIVLFLFGLPECQILIESNEQLLTRSKAVCELPRFDWMDGASQDQFVAVLWQFQQSIDGFELPDLRSRELSIRMYLATGGIIRYVAAVLSKAVRNAIDHGTTKIRMQDLSSAWSEEIVGANTKYPNPFERSFALKDLPSKIALAKTIGQRAVRPQPAARRKPKAVLAEMGM
jgi:hypothetical protein